MERRNVRRAKHPALLIVAASLVTACATGGARAGAPANGAEAAAGDATVGAMPGEHHMHELPATAGTGYTVADVRFMQHMIGHHAQAITMAALAPTHGAGPNVVKLAQKIDISQRDEIVLMQEWLRERGQAVPDSAQALAMQMPGMLTASQLAQLRAARGREFDRLFLTFMIQHHQGALEMVEELFASPGATQDPDIFRFVTDVDADQRDEIYVMRTLLDMLETSPSSAQQ